MLDLSIKYIEKNSIINYYSINITAGGDFLSFIAKRLKNHYFCCCKNREQAQQNWEQAQGQIASTVVTVLGFTINAYSVSDAYFNLFNVFIFLCDLCYT